MRLANALWAELHTRNEQVEKGLRHLVKLQQDDGDCFSSAIEQCYGAEAAKVSFKPWFAFEKPIF